MRRPGQRAKLAIAIAALLGAGDAILAATPPAHAEDVLCHIGTDIEVIDNGASVTVRGSASELLLPPARTVSAQVLKGVPFWPDTVVRSGDAYSDSIMPGVWRFNTTVSKSELGRSGSTVKLHVKFIVPNDFDRNTCDASITL